MKNIFRLRAFTHTHTHRRTNFQVSFLKIFPLFFFLPLLLFGQVRTSVLDIAAGESLESYIPYHENTPLDDVQLMPPVDVAAALAAHEAAGRQAALYGVPIPVDLSRADGDTTDLGGIIIWRLSIRSNEAVSLNFHLGNLSLPLGSELYIYDRAGSMVSGPVTSAHIYEGQYATDIIAGEEVYLEAVILKDSFDLFNLTVHTVIHGFGDTQATNRAYNDSGTCNIDVNCPVGAGFGNQRDAVCLIINNAAEKCSGALISDDCQSLRSFLLTANHCLNGNVTNWVFRFNYDSPNPTTPACRGSNATTWFTYSGSSLKASNSTSDFALLEMNGSVIGQPTLALAGWDRSSTTPTSGMGIHHPQGDVKKISFSTGSLNITANNGGSGTDHIEVVWGTGTTELVSSGSPLFDAAPRIVGQLDGGMASCSSTTLPDYYGRLFTSWTGGGSNSTRLSNWLSTSGTAPTTTNTIRVPSISGTSPVCSRSTQNFTLNDILPGRSATWTATPASLFVTASGTGTTAALGANTSSSSGLGTLTFTISAASGCNTVTVSRQIWVGNPGVTLYGDDYLCPGDRGEALLDYGSDASGPEMQGVSGVVWTYNGPLSTFTGYPDFARYRAGNTPGYGTIGVTVTNTCGSTQVNLPYQVVSCGGKGLALKIFPNPVSGITGIEIVGRETETIGKVSLSVYNPMGAKVLTKILDDRHAQIDMGDIKPGLYFVEVFTEGIFLRERILKIR